jgi:hypothetical protein
MSEAETPSPIGNEEEMWRRAQADMVFSEPGRVRPSSAVFRSSQEDGLSFHRASMTDVKTVLANYGEPYIVRVIAADIRDEGRDFVYDPLPGDRSHYVLNSRLPAKAPRRLATQKAWWVDGAGPPQPNLD